MNNIAEIQKESQPLEEKAKAKRAPRIRHQIISVPDAVKTTVKLVNEGKTSTFSKEDIAAILNISVGGSGLMMLGATISRYGFLKKADNGWLLTPAGRVLVEQTNTPEYTKVCQEAFNRAPFFTEIGQRFNGGKFGQNDILLINFLRLDNKIENPTIVNTIIRTYKESKNFLNSLDLQVVPEQQDGSAQALVQTPIQAEEINDDAIVIYQATFKQVSIKEVVKAKDDLQAATSKFVKRIQAMVALED